MDIKRLDHANLRTTRLAEMVEWYTRVLDMPEGDRPPFSFAGAWLYRHGAALVHLVEVEEEGTSENLKMEHYAMQATGLEGFLAHLKANGIEPRVGRLAGWGIVQVNIWDPDGNHIHIDFPREEGDALGL